MPYDYSLSLVYYLLNLYPLHVPWFDFVSKTSNTPTIVTNTLRMYKYIYFLVYFGMRNNLCNSDQGTLSCRNLRWEVKPGLLLTKSTLHRELKAVKLSNTANSLSKVLNELAACKVQMRDVRLAQGSKASLH